MKTLILAAGYGTRLYPITQHTPKALININGKFLLDFIMEKIEYAQKRVSAMGETIIISNDRFYNHFLSWKRKGKRKITIINDGSRSPDDRLGAVGDIEYALKNYTSDDWLVIGSDNFFDWQLLDFINFAVDKKPHPCIGVYALDDMRLAKHFGVITMDTACRIIDCIEKPQQPTTNKIAVCIYFFPQQSLKFINRYSQEGYSRDTTGKYIEWLAQHIPVYGYLFKGNWVDVGHKESLKAVEKLVN